MGSLVCFELKKIITRKSTLVSCLVIFVLICFVMCANILQMGAHNAEANEDYTGLAAIEYERSQIEPYAGTLTPERIAEDIAHYNEVAFASVAPEELVNLSRESASELLEERVSAADRAMLSHPYYRFLLSPWSTREASPYQTAADMVVNGVDPASFYEALNAQGSGQLDACLEGYTSVSLTQIEYDFWQAKIDEIATPFSYGYVGGWDDILNCVGFLTFAMVAICIALTPVFTGEYAARTDAVLLATRHGRGRLVVAKVIAAVGFATIYFLLSAGVVVGISLMCFGAGGAELPIQVLVPTSPYNVTASQAVWIAVGLGYLIMLGFAGLTLLLSARMRSQIAIFAITVCLLLITGLVGSAASGFMLRALSLFPINSLSPGFLVSQYLSYAAGPVVFEPVVAASLVWACVTVLCLPLAAISFRRHQVV